MSYRTDIHNNPTAFTTAVARDGGLVLDTDYTIGDPFTVGSLKLYTARLLGDPLDITIRLIDKAGFTIRPFGAARWSYICMPKFVWDGFSRDQKRDVIGWMYQHEGGVAMRSLFPNIGRA